MNKTILCGRTTADNDIRMTQAGKKVCSFTLAVDDGRDPNGERKSQFIDCVAWEKSAEFMERYVRKGMRILVEGRLSKRMYEDRSGTKHYPTEVICERIEFADRLDQPKPQQMQMNPAEQNWNTPQEPKADTYPDYSDSSFGISADDLPF